MSSTRTTTFILNEKMLIKSSELEEEIIFSSSKTLSLLMDISKTPLDWMKESIKEWISHVEVDKERFSLEEIEPSHHYHGGVVIKYDNSVLANFVLEKSCATNSDGKRIFRASIHIKYSSFAKDILENNQTDTIYINDGSFYATHTKDNEPVSLLQALDDIIPTRSEAKVKAICHILKVSPTDILFDTYQKRYIITSDYLSHIWTHPSHPDRFYKFVSLNVFENMLQNRTFRMNSIIAQSDESESLYFGNFLCHEYENEKDRLKGILKEENILISCFTTEGNDPHMWENYGNNGMGVMLEFESTAGNILHPVQYIDEESETLVSLRNNITSLLEGETRLYFSEIDSKHRFIKSNKYEKENEWRLILDYKGSLQSTVYGNTRARYKDFPFIGNLLPDLNIALVSITIGPKNRSSNAALLIKDSRETFGDINIRLGKQS